MGRPRKIQRAIYLVRPYAYIEVGAGLSRYAPNMPWHVTRTHPDCTGENNWAVVKDADNTVAGCHPSKRAANDQLAALYASENADGH